MSTLIENLEDVNRRMGDAANKVGRNIADINLVAVSKTKVI